MSNWTLNKGKGRADYQITTGFEPYDNLVKRLARYKGDAVRYVAHLMKQDRFNVKIAIEMKAEQMTPLERENAQAYFPLGYFDGLSDSEKLAAYSAVLDAEYLRDVKREIKSCTPYSGEESIFQTEGVNIKRNEDLIEMPFGKREPDTNIFRIGGTWGYYDRRIPLEVYGWLENCFKNNPKRIRVEPNGFYDHRPPQLVLECLVIPPKFKWWKSLSLHNGQCSGSCYRLLGNDLANMADYQDYNIHHVREIQTIAKRRYSNYLSLMVEELSEYKHPAGPNTKYVVGRMIHLDSNAVYGTSFKDAVLKHIDLAYNLYIDNDADVRMGQNLALGGMVQDATLRTHVLRIDNVPFDTLFKMAYSFFKSKCLVDEWLGNEFK